MFSSLRKQVLFPSVVIHFSVCERIPVSFWMRRYWYPCAIHANDEHWEDCSRLCRNSTFFYALKALDELNLKSC